MPGIDLPVILILLVAALCLLVLITMLCLQLSRRLTRIERLLSESTSADNSETHAPSAAETATGGAFETFLNEEPSRRNLSKSEQFAAYRKWRQENGLNWSGT